MNKSNRNFLWDDEIRSFFLSSGVETSRSTLLSLSITDPVRSEISQRHSDRAPRNQRRKLGHGRSTTVAREAPSRQSPFVKEVDGVFGIVGIGPKPGKWPERQLSYASESG